jgi:transcriptional regulator with XRE-family HTH domain
MSYESNIFSWYAMSDPAIIKEIGIQLKNIRLRKNLSQQQLASLSGLYRSTISEIENGRPASLLSFVQLLRGLGKLEILGSMVEVPVISPLTLAREAGLIRKRASSLKKYDNQQPEDGTW